jgi:excisionase family DNA binding protein
MTESGNFLIKGIIMVARIITKRLFTPKEAAEYLGISERQLEYLRSNGVIRQTRLPDTKKRLYDVFDLDELIDKLKEKTILKTA